tara:strand:+ start:7425 stop:8063 length:639 start_codon:yes stop_codon:yes gene_type:complete
MNNLIVQTKEDRLPAVVKNQLESTGPIQTVKTEYNLALIPDVILEIQKPLAITATASELNKAIKKMFVLMQKPNSSTGDVTAEIAEYIKMLEGQPLWAVEQAVDNVCKQYSFRDFSKLFQEIKKLIEPRVKKIERLQNIYKQSLKEIEEEKALKKAMDECPSMEDALKEAADNGNKFAKDFLRAHDFKAREQAVLEYKKCNNLGDNFLKSMI